MVPATRRAGTALGATVVGLSVVVVAGRLDNAGAVDVVPIGGSGGPACDFGLLELQLVAITMLPMRLKRSLRTDPL